MQSDKILWRQQIMVIANFLAKKILLHGFAISFTGQGIDLKSIGFLRFVWDVEQEQKVKPTVSEINILSAAIGQRPRNYSSCSCCCCSCSFPFVSFLIYFFKQSDCLNTVNKIEPQFLPLENEATWGAIFKTAMFFLINGGAHSTEVAFALFTHRPQVQIPRLLKLILVAVLM